MEFGKTLRVNTTPIPGLLVLDLPVHGDNRGWFKENWQREKMLATGVPDFGPVQNNISFNTNIGTTRGIHAEPWDKLISLATGRIFGAWVDLRDGPNFGTVFTAELDPTKAVFIPRGVGNAFQTLEPDTAYVYLVNAHFSANNAYTSINLADEALAIHWPIPLERSELSAKDRSHPPLADIIPIRPQRTLVLGASGQLGRALRSEYHDTPQVEFADRSELDLTSPELSTARPWTEYDTVINAAAYTAVDEAETQQGRRAAWTTNVSAIASLARVAVSHNITLIHVSSDYVFDGSMDRPYRENDSLAPLGVYGQTKAAGDEIVATVPRHYIVRASWVIGDGRNFVRTMQSLATRGIDPSVVNDQFGRLTFASELARAIRYLVDGKHPYGIYNVTNSGPPMSWAEIARQVFSLSGHDPGRVVGVTTKEYLSNVGGPVAQRPLNSTLDITKIQSIGFVPADSIWQLKQYLGTH